MAINFTNGTINSTTSEQTVFDITANEHFATWLFTHNMQASDQVTIRVYTLDENTATLRLYESVTLSGVQTDPSYYIPFVPCKEYKVTIQRVAGSDRAYTWLRVQVTGDTSSAFTGSADVKTATLGLRRQTVHLYKSLGTYYAQKWDGTIISSSTNAQTVIQAAINQGGILYFSNGQEDNGYTDWILPGGLSNPAFTINANSKVHIVADNQVYIASPSGYSGVVFELHHFSEDYGIQGLGFYNVGNTTSHTNIKLEPDSTHYCSDAVISDITMYDANKGIELETNSSRWINGMTFRNIRIFGADIGIEFDLNSGEISHNLFENVGVYVTGSNSTEGFKDVDGKSNTFVKCSVWDMDLGGGAQEEMNILSTASDTTLIGCQCTGGYGYFIDEGLRTNVIGGGNGSTRLGGKSISFNPLPDMYKFGAWYGSGTTAADGILQSRLTAVNTGTGSSVSGLDSTGIYRTYDTGATINSITGLHVNSPLGRRINNIYFKNQVYPVNNTNLRIFSGLVSTTSAPASAADPLNVLEGVGLWFDSAVSANWKIKHNDGVGASSEIDTGVAVATSTKYPIEIFAHHDDNFRVNFNGVGRTITTNIPSSTVNLSFWVYMENTSAAARSYRNYYIIVRNDM